MMYQNKYVFNKKGKAAFKPIYLWVAVILLVNVGTFTVSYFQKMNRTAGLPVTEVVSLAEDVVFKYENNGQGEDENQAARIPLSDDLCEYSYDWYEIPKVFGLSEEQLDEIKEGMAYFYNRTGVQPYLIFSEEANVGYFESDALAYLKTRYKELFDDEGHIIFLYGADVFDYGENNFKEYFIGTDAQTVLDTDAMDILCSKRDIYFDDTDSLAGAIYYMFTEAADEIMDAETTVVWEETWVDGDNPYILGGAEDMPINDTGEYVTVAQLLMLTGGFILFSLIVIGIMRLRQKRRDSREDNPFRTEDNPYEYNEDNASFSSRRSGSYNSYGNKSAQNYPVTCPYCRATAYLKENGCCQYCGNKLR